MQKGAWVAVSWHHDKECWGPATLLLEWRYGCLAFMTLKAAPGDGLRSNAMCMTDQLGQAQYPPTLKQVNNEQYSIPENELCQ